MRGATRAEPTPFEVKKAFWGYVIRGTGGPPLLLQVAQGVVLAFGGTFTAAALVLLTTSDGAPGQAMDTMRSGLIVVLSSLALLLMWFATRGGVVELHLDMARGELRELVRHRAGRATLIGRHGFDGSVTLALDRGGPPGTDAALVLRLTGGEGLCIARGPDVALMELRRRLEQDLRRRGGGGGLTGRPGRMAA